MGKDLEFEEAKHRLKDAVDNEDDEDFHSMFDDLIEERLAQLDPDFLKAMKDYYDETGMSRWCA